MNLKTPDSTDSQWTDDADRWDAVRNRDASADGAFYYSVRTTGVYCRPGCPARRPKREHVAFHPTASAAEEAGFRPCQRCHPNGVGLSQRHAAAVTQACRRMAEAENPLTLSTLAAEAGMSPHHFHRIFKAVTGLTPKAYAMARRADRARGALSRRSSVTEAIYASGYQSGSRFYEGAKRMLGMKPINYQGKGEGERIQFAAGQCTLGAVVIAATEAGVCAVLLGDDPAVLLKDLQDRFSHAYLIGGDARFEHVVRAVIQMLDSDRRGEGLPIDLQGTVFQQKVWHALREIPRGSTASYAEIAARIGMPGAARAVGRACGENPIAVFVPCHRVVRQDGSLSGYRWGIERKRKLLKREAAPAAGSTP